MLRLQSDSEKLLRLAEEYRPALSEEDGAWLSYFRARLDCDLDQYSRAEAVLAPLTEAVLPASLRFRLLVLRGVALRHLENLEAGHRLALQALELAPYHETEPHLLASAHQLLGEIEYDRRDIGSAQTELRLAVECAKKSGDLLYQARALNALAMATQRVDSIEALALFESILPLLSAPADKLRLAALTNNIGRTAADVGEWGKSLAAYEKSLALKREAADWRGIATTRLNMARVLEKLGRHAEARASLTEAAELFEKLSRPREAAISMRELARLLRRLGLESEARLEAERTAKYWRDLGEQDIAIEVRREFSSKNRAYLVATAVVAGSLIALFAIVAILV